MVAVSARVSYGGEGLGALAGATLTTPSVIRPRAAGAPAVLTEAESLADGTVVYTL